MIGVVTRQDDRRLRRKQTATERREATNPVNPRAKRDRSFVENWMVGALVGAAVDLASAVVRRARRRRAGP